MGHACPPYYGNESIKAKIKKISEIDAKINALLIEREKYVEDLEDAIKEEDSSED